MPILLLSEEERLGTTVAGRYRLDAVLGSGGMAVVFRAKHTWTGRDVAVKFLDPRKTKDLDIASKRFLKEGRVIGALSHPNVVKVLDMGKDEHGIVFQVLELLHGYTLASRLDEDLRLTAQETIDAVLPIMDALTAAHEMEIIHRDLKPENIFISSDEAGASIPKLLDFGVAKGLDDELAGNLTREGSVLGTPYYMAPEQAKGASSVGPAADVFSLAAVIYECLAGDLPFGDREPADYAIELLSAGVPPVRSRNASIDEGIAAVVDQALARNPEDRFASMLEFRQALGAAATKAELSVPEPAVFTPAARAALLAMKDDDAVDTLGEGTMLSDLLSGSVPPDPRRRKRLFMAMGALAVVAAIGTFAIMSVGDETTTPPVPAANEPAAISTEETPRAEATESVAVVEEGEEPDEMESEEELQQENDEVVRRLAVKRVSFPRELTRSQMGGQTRMTMEAATMDSSVIMEETEPSTMRPDRPNIVREF
jgi:serine/threonine-protein kinase